MFGVNLSFKNIGNVIKEDLVLFIFAVCALVSMIFTPPSADYVNYFDFQVLCLLFCFMIVISGVQSCGFFDFLSARLLSGRRSFRRLCVIFALLPFLTSMFITNDVALIAFVPFTLLILDKTGQTAWTIYIVVLQTIAANLGSMLTPFGNPQNLFLFSKFHLDSASFFATVLPFALVSLGLVLAACIPAPARQIYVRELAAQPLQRKRLLLFFALFVLCILSVLHIVHYILLTVIVVLAFALFARGCFRRVDYGLLFTFACFFVFSGNMSHIPEMRDCIEKWMETSAFGTSVAMSQIISNVPTAILLSGFTGNATELLIGTNIGGLGTIVASLASLISFKYYLKTPQARPGKYLAVFTLANVAALAVLAAVFGFLY